MKMLRIVKAKDHLMWYADKVGELVPYCGQWPEAYKSREPAGHINRVEFDDAEIVEVAGLSADRELSAEGHGATHFSISKKDAIANLENEAKRLSEAGNIAAAAACHAHAELIRAYKPKARNQ